MKFTPKRAPSPAEARLAEAVAAKAAAEGDMSAAQVVLARLEDQARATAPAEAAIARFDAAQSAAMATWAADENAGDPPQPDWQHRERLERELSAARATAASAVSAMATPRAAMNAAGQLAAAAGRVEWIARKLISIEEAQKILPPLAAAIRGVYEAKHRVDLARESILANLNYADGDVGEVFTALSEFDAKRREAESIPLNELIPPEGIAPDGQHGLARALAALGPVGPAWDVGAPPQSAPLPVDPSRRMPI